VTSPRLAREPLDDLSRWLTRAVVAAAVLAALGLALPGQVGRDVAVGAVVVVTVAPLLRVGWLIVAWWRSGDWVFVRVGCGLLVVVAVAAGVAVFT